MGNLLRVWLCFALATMQIATSGCIHISPNETQSVTLRKQDLSAKKPNEPSVEYVVYKTAELPLEDFLYNFNKGEYKRAFREIKLNYRPSNFSNKALEELVSAGFVPVFVNIANNGPVDIRLSEKSFSLGDGKTVFPAIGVDDLPREFQHFSPTALAANVYNTGVVVVSFAAVLVAFAILTEGHGQLPPNVFGLGPFPNDTKSGDPVLNDLNRVVKVDYRSYLISASTLKPGESRKGLVFFFAPDVPRDQDFQLIWKTK